MTESKTQTKKPSWLKWCCWAGVVFVVLLIILAFPVIRKAYFYSASSGANRATPTASTTSKPSSTSPAPTSTIASEDLLNYFIETTTYNSTMDQRKGLSRWTKNPITVELEGQVNDLAVTTVDRAIYEFNAVSNTKLSRVQSGGDIQINFLPREQLPAQSGSENYKGITYAEPNSGCILSAAKIYIDTAEMEGSEVMSAEDRLILTVRHELLHALGFSGHDITKNRGCTALSKIACLLKSYSQYDISAIKMMYNSGVPLCSSEDQIRSFFSQNIPQ